MTDPAPPPAPTSPSQLRVFLSHNSKDKPFVRRLAVDLAANGITPWLDEKEINVSDSLLHTISEALGATDHLIAIYSANFNASAWAQQEIAAAMAVKMKDGSRRVILARIDDTPIPTIFAGDLYADFRSDYSTGLDSIVRAIRNVPAVPSPVGAPPLEVDADRLTKVLNGLDGVSLSRVINRVPGALSTDSTLLPVGHRVGFLMAFVVGEAGPGRNAVARILVDEFPQVKAKLGPFA